MNFKFHFTCEVHGNKCMIEFYKFINFELHLIIKLIGIVYNMPHKIKRKKKTHINHNMTQDNINNMFELQHLV